MLNNTGYGHQIKALAASDVVSSQTVEVADTLGIAWDSAASGEEYMVMVQGEHGRADVVAAEVWLRGQNVYWNQTTKRFTNEETHWPVGRAAEDKAQGVEFGIVQLDKPNRKPGEVETSFRYDNLQAIGDPAVNFGAQGDYELRDFGGDVQVVIAELVSSGLTADTVTIAIGDGAGANDQILSATAASTLAGYDNVPDLAGGATLPVTLDKVVLRLAGTGAFTAGLLVVRIGYVSA